MEKKRFRAALKDLKPRTWEDRSLGPIRDFPGPILRRERLLEQISAESCSDSRWLVEAVIAKTMTGKWKADSSDYRSSVPAGLALGLPSHVQRILARMIPKVRTPAHLIRGRHRFDRSRYWSIFVPEATVINRLLAHGFCIYAGSEEFCHSS